MEEDKHFVKLRSLINKIFGVSDIDPNTEINKLRTVSEDNDRFIALFQSEFNVDMSSFPYYQYFEEDEFILLSLLRRLFRMNKKHKKGLTISHLLAVIKKGKWFE